MVVVQYVLAGSMRFVESRRSHDVAPNRAAIFAYGERSSYGLAGDATEPCHSMWATLQGRGLHEHSRALREQGRSILDDRGDGGWRRR
ncbi:MAG: hypothetical protein GVY28_10360 [Alphaproteobacteria bacterium]|jgi:hypothetical protein|nr:hypothetical protein [Alphaproteobacteria bacterium]